MTSVSSPTDARAMNSEQKLAIYQQASNLVPPLVSSLTSAAVLGVGAVQVVAGTLSAGELVAFQSLVLSFSVISRCPRYDSVQSATMPQVPERSNARRRAERIQVQRPETETACDVRRIVADSR